MQIPVFWYLSGRSVGIHQSVGESYCPHHQGGSTWVLHNSQKVGKYRGGGGVKFSDMMVGCGWITQHHIPKNWNLHWVYMSRAVCLGFPLLLLFSTLWRHSLVKGCKSTSLCPSYQCMLWNNRAEFTFDWVPAPPGICALLRSSSSLQILTVPRSWCCTRSLIVNA